MRLVHGTSLKNSISILDTGLLPRGRKPSIWAVPTCEKAIYLTNAYGLFYAINSSNKANEACLLEIETEELDNAMFVADEDALEQVWQFNKQNFLPFDPELTNEMSIEQRARWFGENLLICKACGYDAKWSLGLLGNCAYLGRIPKEKITRIVKITDLRTQWWMQFFDPNITFANYMFLGQQYRMSQLVLLGMVEEAAKHGGNGSEDFVEWLDGLIRPHREIMFSEEKVTVS